MKIRQFVSVLFIFSILVLSVDCQSQKGDVAQKADSGFIKTAYAGEDSSQTAGAQTDHIYESRQNAITRAVARVSPAVVGITVKQVRRYVQRSPFNSNDPVWKYMFPELFKDRVYEQKIQSLGSGFLISPDGYLLTNDHVVGQGGDIIVTLSGGEQHKAKVVGNDQTSDICLLKIDGDKFPYMEFGNSDDLIVGEWVIALGNPFGLFELNNQPTVTVGVISAVNRDWGRMPESGRVYLDMIQTDAAINHGNSGGPLVDALGQVIGMNTFIYTGSQYQDGFVGIGFAIPANKIREIADEIKAKGGVDRNYWLGIARVQDLSPIIVKAFKLKTDKGVLVAQVDPGSPADEAGLQPEDIIVSANGKQIDSSEDLINTLTNLDLKVGDELNMTIVRNNKEKQLTLKLKHMPE